MRATPPTTPANGDGEAIATTADAHELEKLRGNAESLAQCLVSEKKRLKETQIS